MARQFIATCALDSGPHIHRCRRIFFWSLLDRLLRAASYFYEQATPMPSVPKRPSAWRPSTAVRQKSDCRKVHATWSPAPAPDPSSAGADNNGGGMFSVGRTQAI